MRPKNLGKEDAIRTIALQIISEEGLENLSMQRLAKAANVSPRTIYIKYENKEDLLVKLYIKEVLGPYEKAVLEGFSEEMPFAEGMKKLWDNSFTYLITHKHAFTLMKYGKSSPLLNRAYQQENIREGDFFSPISRFFQRHAQAGLIRHFPHDVYRAILMSPLHELVNEYFDYTERPRQIITPEVVAACCEVAIKGIMNS